MHLKFLICIVLIFSFFACSRNKSGNTLHITDDLGNEFSFDTIPSNVISLAPSITEAIYYIKADEYLKGVTKFCDYPPEAKNKTMVGGILDPNIEIISRINPDLIFLTTEGNSELTYRTLKESGFKVFVLNPVNVEGIKIMLEKLNSIFKTNDGSKIIHSFSEQLLNYTNKNIKKTFAGFISIKPLITFNKNTYINDVFSRAGYINIFQDEMNSYPNVNDETLLINNPGYIFIFGDKDTNKSSYLINEFTSRFSELTAVKNKKIFILDEDIISRPGPRILLALQDLNKYYQ